MKIKAHCPFLGHTGYNAHARGFFTALSKMVDLRVDNYTWCDDRHNYLTPHQKKIISEVTLKGHGGKEGQYPPDWKDHIEDFEYDIDLVLHEHNHRVYWRDHPKPKIAYTVWETETFSDNFFNRMLEYDELWVPSKWQKECAVAQGYPSDRMHVVPEAVEDDCVPAPEVPADDSVFTFCLMGRWDRRKSTSEILKCFVELFGNNPKVQLIASIDNPFANDGLSTQDRWVKMGMGEISNVVFKSFLNREEYVRILQTSHVFLSCSRAEGWNIPLIEAMACGIPSLYSDCSGQTEFAKGKGTPIRILGKEPARAGAGEVSSPFTAELPGSFFSPDFGHLKKKMQYAMDNYNTLKQAALKDSVEIRSKYTWENAAKTALDRLKGFYNHHCSDSDHLMIVAHPDDETIFGFSELDAPHKWKVVCMAPDGRADDFKKAMAFYGITDYEIEGFEAEWQTPLPPLELDQKIKKLLESREWKKIVTHSPVGEYGNIQHRNIFEAVARVTDNFYVFCKTPEKLNGPDLERKRQALKIYDSEDIVSQIEHLNGDWFICNDMSTNYIEYGTVEKYSKEKDVTPFVGCWEKSPASKPKPKSSTKNKIFLPLITYSGMCHTEFAMGVMSTVLQIKDREDTDMVITPIGFESLISRGRNAAAAWALSGNHTHLLFIDSDIVFKPEDVFKLLDMNEDVVVGAYPKKYYNRQKMEILSKVSPEAFNEKEDWKHLVTDFSTEFNVDNFEKAKRGEVFDVSYAATGFMLIKTDALRTIIDKRPDLRYTNDIDGYMSAGEDNFYDFFGVGINTSTQKYESEDYGFCSLWRSVGGKIYVAPTVNLAHIGRHEYPGKVIDQATLFTAYK